MLQGASRCVFFPCIFHAPLNTALLPALLLAPQFLYTLKVTDTEKADKITLSLPPGLQRKDINV